MQHLEVDCKVFFVYFEQSCLEFDSVSYLKKVRAAAGTTVAAVDAPDSPEPE